MKLEYQANKLRRGDKWHCNFCPFERERSLTAIYKIISYNGSNNDYNDIAYICVECKKALDDDTLPHCSDCGRIMRNRIECFCDLRKDEPVKTLTITEIMAQSYVGRLEQQNKDLKQQLTSAKEEINSHLEALEVSKDWHSNQKKELLDKIQRLESEVEQLRKQETQQTAQIEIKETKKWPWLKIRK
jgi:hypothetical protein